MNIGIDLGEVVFEFVRGYLRIYELRYGKKAPAFEEIYTPDIWKVLEITKTEENELMDDFYHSELFKNLALTEGANEGVHALAESDDIYFITSRPRKLIPQTIASLDKHFYDIVFNVFYSGDRHNGQGKKKAGICKQFNIKTIVEDDPRSSLECANNGIDVILFDRPWNQDIKNINNLKRANGWRELPALLR